MNSFTLPGEDARNEQVALARVRRAEMVKAFIESAEYRERFFGSATGNQQGTEMQSEAGRGERTPLATVAYVLFDPMFWRVWFPA